MLEVLVHLEIDPEDLPDNLRLLRVQVPDEASIRKVSSLPLGWEAMPEHTRQIGNAWLEAGSSLLLQVPSAIMPHTANMLFNPRHPLAGQASLTVETLELDKRLLPFRNRQGQAEGWRGPADSVSQTLGMNASIYKSINRGARPDIYVAMHDHKQLIFDTYRWSGL